MTVLMTWLRGLWAPADHDMDDWVSPCRCGPADLCPCDEFIVSYDAHKAAKIIARADEAAKRGPYR